MFAVHLAHLYRGLAFLGFGCGVIDDFHLVQFPDGCCHGIAYQIVQLLK